MKSPSLGVVMDPISTIAPQKDSTLALLREAQRRDITLFHLTLNDIDIRDGCAFGEAAPLAVTDDDADWFRLQSPRSLPLGELDLIFMRKDPPFNAEYIFATYVLQRAQAEGATVVNDPQALRDVNEKAFAAWFPDLTPPAIITRSMARMRDFLDEHGHIVVKPLDMMGGYSIFALERTDKNLAVILETITAGETRFAMAQRYLPEVVAGDRRILLIDGRAVNPALNRIPRGDDNRGNLMAGARAEARELTARDIEICERVGAELAVRGVAFAGIDVIGDYLTEVNITSPTGIREIQKLADVDAAALLFDNLLARLG
ncbi:glutathione synthase [Candidatus Foliamicus sp.]